MRAVTTGLIYLWLNIGIVNAQTDSTNVRTDTTIVDLESPIEAYADMRGNIRAEPTIASELVGNVSKYSDIIIHSYKKGTPYIRVSHGNVTGWINYKLLSDRFKTRIGHLIEDEGVSENTRRTREDRPDYPHGRPDDLQEYKSGTYHSITYIYHCHNRNYKSYDYVKRSGRWVLDSEYTTDGICY